MLIAPVGNDFEKRLRAEAAAIGIELVSDSRARPDDPPSVVVARNGAAGALRILSASSVALYLPLGGDPSPRYETFDADPRYGDSFALRLAEEIRSRLVKLGIPLSTGVGASPGEPTAAPSSTSTGVAPVPGASPHLGQTPPPIGSIETAGSVNARSTEIGASAGLATTVPGGGMGASLHAVAALRLSLSSRWGATIQGLLPLTTREFSEPEGQARIRLGLVTAQVDRLLWRTPRWSVSASGGAGALILTMEGQPAEGYMARRDRLAVPAFFVEGEVAMEISRWFAVRGALGLGAVTPRPVVRFDGREIAVWGRPFMLGSVVLDVRMSLGSAERRP